jgi:hypothetical protein
MRTTPTLQDWCESSARSLKSGTVVGDLGGRNINIPPPTGFFRFGGKSNRVDAQLKSSLTSTNKLLAAFASESDLALAIVYLYSCAAFDNKSDCQNKSSNFNAV